eukprot:6189383-Pleurochrysis_carterae.AAC.2
MSRRLAWPRRLAAPTAPSERLTGPHRHPAAARQVAHYSVDVGRDDGDHHQVAPEHKLADAAEPALQTRPVGEQHWVRREVQHRMAHEWPATSRRLRSDARREQCLSDSRLERRTQRQSRGLATALRPRLVNATGRSATPHVFGECDPFRWGSSNETARAHRVVCLVHQLPTIRSQGHKHLHVLAECGEGVV